MAHELRDARQAVGRLGETLRALTIVNLDDGSTERLIGDSEITRVVQFLDGRRVVQQNRARERRVDPDDPKTQEAIALAIAGAAEVLADDKMLMLWQLMDDPGQRRALMSAVGWATILPAFPAKDLDLTKRIT